MTGVVVLGGASWNLMIHLEHFPLPEPATIPNTISYAAAGSTGIGKALAAWALGHPTLLHATIGDDDDGQRVRTFCSLAQLETQFDIDPGGTSRHVNLMDGEGRRISMFLWNGSPQPSVDTEALAKPLAEAEVIFLNITQSSVPLLPLVQQSRAEVWVDLHDFDGENLWHRQFIAAADVIQLSDEALPDPRPLMTRLAETARLVVCTRGKNGVLAYAPDDGWIELSAAPAKLVDSNGAGDMLCVALWHALRGGRPLRDALRFAAVAAAAAIESPELVPLDLDPAAVDARLALWV